MKWVIFILFLISSNLLYAQTEELVYMSKEKHDELRKNVDDYRRLIIEHSKLKTEYHLLNDSYQQLLHEKSQSSDSEVKVMNELEFKNKILNDQYALNKSQQKRYDDLAISYAKLSETLKGKDKTIDFYKRKYYGAQKFTKESGFWRTVAIGFASLTAILIVTSTGQN